MHALIFADGSYNRELFGRIKVESLYRYELPQTPKNLSSPALCKTPKPHATTADFHPASRACYCPRSCTIDIELETPQPGHPPGFRIWLRIRTRGAFQEVR